MEMARPDGVGAPVPVRVTNADGASPYVLVCDHASNFLPTEFGTLGLDAGELSRHIAWDPGALPVSRFMADALDAPLIESCISRLVIDCNRSLNASNLIPSVSETTSIPGNVNISPEEKQARIDIAWRPFHAAIEKIVDDRLAAGHETRLVSIHSFTPVYMGVSRPWHVGIIHDEDRRIADPLLKGLGNIEGAVVGSNVPYSPADQVYFTLERHGRVRGLACAMIEIRNDEISDQAGQRKWADVLAALLSQVEFATQPVVEQAGTHE